MSRPQLPSGWKCVQVGEICRLVNGRAFKPSEWSREGLPIVRIQNLNNPLAPFNRYNGPIDERFLIDNGELLFAWSGTPGTSFGAHIWNRGKAILNQHIFRVIFDPTEFDGAFLSYSLNDRMNHFIGIAHGAAGLSHVTKPQIEATEILQPPLGEQCRIVSKIESLLTASRRAEAALAVVGKHLNTFQRSVFNAAASGYLTAKWRARVGRIQPWRHVQLETVLLEKPRNGFSPRAVEYETSVKSLTLSATTSGRFRAEHHKYIDADIPADSHLWLEPGDILIQRANTIDYLGTSAIYDGPRQVFIYPDLMMKCRPNNLILPSFLHYVLSSDNVRSYFRSHATGTAGTMPKINQQTVLKAPIRLPPIEEQHTIVALADALLKAHDGLEDRHQLTTHWLEKLTPTILAKAFRGELVPQDPNDEPASVLLERIRSAPKAESVTHDSIQTSLQETMKKPITVDQIHDVIAALPSNDFTFEDLRTRISGEYNDIKDEVFELLEEKESPQILQVFDKKTKRIRFERAVR